MLAVLVSDRLRSFGPRLAQQLADSLLIHMTQVFIKAVVIAVLLFPEAEQSFAEKDRRAAVPRGI